jgi:16S rRNA (cytosine967-C5)-methyltransferase
MKASARDLARKILRRVERDGAFANRAVAGVLDSEPTLASADRALLKELVYGVLRHRRILDHVIGQHLKQTSPLKAELRDILRMAVYQQLFLERIPEYAAVDEAVSASRRLSGKKVGGFVNAVLRRVDSEDLQRKLPPPGIRRFALCHSLPDRWAKRIARELEPDELEAYGTAINQRAKLTIRTNRSRMNRDDLALQLRADGASIDLCTISEDGLFLSGLDRPFASPSFASGYWSVQDEAAQLAAQLLEPEEGSCVLDGCAGLGGKSTHLAALVGSDGTVISGDRDPRKLAELRTEAQRLGLKCDTREMDLCSPESMKGISPDAILLDAPCSASGLFRRHPERRYRREELSLSKIIAVQRRMLEVAVGGLGSGGRLVYAVCSVLSVEGREQIESLLADYPQLSLEPPISSSLKGVFESGMQTLWPHRHGTDGFFLARLKVN